MPAPPQTAARTFGFEVVARDGDARAGRLTTAHGEVATPAFMPVGTRAAVKAMAPEELWQLGYRLVLANTYHLALRPGAELIEELGGVGRFMGFRRRGADRLRRFPGDEPREAQRDRPRGYPFSLAP